MCSLLFLSPGNDWRETRCKRGSQLQDKSQQFAFQYGCHSNFDKLTFQNQGFYLSQFFSSMGMMGKWSCHAMFQSNKKGQISPWKFLQWLGNTWQHARSCYPEKASTTLRFDSSDVVFDTFIDIQFLHSIALSSNFSKLFLAF